MPKPHRPAGVWALAGPMIVSNVSVPLLGMVDTAVVGHLPDPRYIGAVAVGGVIFSFLYWGFGFLRMGTTGLTAQALGGGDLDEVRAVLLRALLLALALALTLLALQRPLRWLALTLMASSPDVATHATAYFDARVWSAPAALVNYVLIGWLLGMQNARAPLLMMLCINITNIVLDLWFVLGLQLAVVGVAWASVLAEYLGALLGVWLLRRTLAGARPANWSWRTVVSPPALRRLLTVNRDIFIRTALLLFGFAFFTAQAARQGDTMLAANAVLLTLQSFMAYALDGFAHAAEALTGRAVGQRDRRALRDALRTATIWSLGLACAFAAVYGLAGNLIVAVITDLPDVRAAAARYLPWMVLSPLVSVWSFLLDGVFIGATRTRTLRNAMLVSVLAVYLPAWWLAQPLGNHGLWLAFTLFMAARGVTLGAALGVAERRGGFIPRPRPSAD